MIVIVQYGVLSDASFFDQQRAAVASFVALAIIAPLVLTTALVAMLGLTLALSPVWPS